MENKALYTKEEVINIIKSIQQEYEECGKSFCTSKTIWEICEEKINELELKE